MKFLNRTLIVIYIIYNLSSQCYAQADKWYFGVNAAINFSSGAPVALDNSALNTNEGCSSISDTSGNLLFYTDGISVWDSTHHVIPNGSGLLAGSSSTQAALIMKYPASNTQYYIFTTDEAGGSNGFKYSIVDVTLNGGLGDVTIKNFSMHDSITEKLSGITCTNGNEWVVVHGWGNDQYYAYNVGPFGISPNPMISHAGIVHNTSAIQNTYGQLKFNTCGTMAAAAIGYLDTVDLLNFDCTTGTFTYFMSIPFNDHVYGVEFSPDGTKLYVSTYTAPTLRQFDLSSGVPANIIASSTGLTITLDIYGLQLAPDKKIYAVKSFSQFLGVINSPDVTGPSCNYVDNGVDLDPNFLGHTAALTLPGFDQSYFAEKGQCDPTFTNELIQDHISIFPNPFRDKLEVTSEGKGVFTLFDLTGKIVFKINIDSRQQIIYPNISNGMYVSQLEVGSVIKRGIAIKN